MKRILILAIIILLYMQFTLAADIGRIWPSERKTWIDPEFEHRITQWTDHPGQSWHLYFNIETFINPQQALIFSERSGEVNFFRLDLITGNMIQMTDERGIQPYLVWHWPKHQTLWYVSDGRIKSLNTDTFETRVIKELPFIPCSMTVTCDAKFIVVSADIGEKINSCNIGPYAIFKIRIQDGHMTQISPGYGFVISHLQANPVDSTLLSYCWQHQSDEEDAGVIGKTPLRIWWLDINGRAGGPIAPQKFGMHRTHEFWFYDGSRIGFSARYKFGPQKGEQFIGSCRPDGSGRRLHAAPVKYAHSQLYKDNRHWVVDIYEEMILTLLTLAEGQDQIMDVEKLFRHGSSWETQQSHPHPHFSPDGKMIMFSSDRTGVPNVYSVEIDL